MRIIIIFILAVAESRPIFVEEHARRLIVEQERNQGRVDKNLRKLARWVKLLAERRLAMGPGQA